MADNTQYESVGSGLNYSLEKNKRRSNRSKWIVLGSIITLLALIAIGVGVGVSVSNKNKNKNNNDLSSSSSSSSGSNSTDSSSSDANPPKQTDPNDPSTFVKDPNLKQSFYGMAYTPEGSLLPDCGNTLNAVINDIQVMSQLTKRVRLYGADCNQSALVLEAIKQTKVDMEVFLGNYPTPDDETAYTRQRDTIKAAIQTYGTDHIAGITVGNEYILNYLNAHGATDPNSAVGNTGGEQLVADINDTRSMLNDLKLSKTIPVGNSDAGSYFNNLVLEAVDYGLSNVHPWFANTTIQDAASWTATFFEETNVQPAAQLPNKPKMYIAETGWPSQSSDAGNANNGASDASEANLQIFLDNFVCQANTNGTGYFFFEFTDEPWKDKLYGGVEGHWGLFHSNRTLKRVTIPDCPAP
ncbi:glycoside hydrolase family 17 protein [Armillaria novae-zelandiae]|uniref:glucan endo-1,3-beta-D-glucosidase n=1 Tax=Armillaria novae-zelandiae TaxID=153914 RepID=A0AA39PWR9_9AGAR|nr:glycoside hydrolase family 17 protein [Armillaria novae-zelandiae]